MSASQSSLSSLSYGERFRFVDAELDALLGVCTRHGRIFDDGHELLFRDAAGNPWFEDEIVCGVLFSEDQLVTLQPTSPQKEL